MSTFHQQTNEQIEVLNHNLENILKCLAGKKLKIWGSLFSLAEFTYSNSVNHLVVKVHWKCV